MLQIRESNRFSKSLKKVSKYKSFKQEKYEYVLMSLSNQISLPKSYKDHALIGNKKGQRECHISPDILLIYKVEKDYIYLDLLDIGSHSELFK